MTITSDVDVIVPPAEEPQPRPSGVSQSPPPADAARQPPRRGRDTSRDGSYSFWIGRLIMRSFWFGWLVRNWPWFARMVNRFAINFVANSTRNRPHPFSTASNYTSWFSLTDRSYFARHVPADPEFKNTLPAVADVTDLFRRPDNKEDLCPKSTMLFPAFAQYLTDSFLRTDMDNRARTTSTHQIDLSALYGRTEEQTRALRLLQGGLLKSQPLRRADGVEEEYPLFYFEDDGITVRREFEVLDPPLGHNPNLPRLRERKIFAAGGDRANATPQVSMVNTLFLREHNRIARELNRLYGAKPGRPDGWGDEQIFQTARNIMIPMFITIVVEEYINHISALSFDVTVDLTLAERAIWNRPNWMAVEFNLLYRWHSLVPNRIEWPRRCVPQDLIANASEVANRPGVAGVPARFLHLDNSFLINAGLAAALDSSSRQKAARIGLKNTPAFMFENNMEVEERTIRQGRDNNVASYNAYRAAIGLPPVDDFWQVTGDATRVRELERVYGTKAQGGPGRLEFYTGLFAEDLLPNSPLPNLMAFFVGVDAFTQALTNPLLSPHVFNETTFTPEGLGWITSTHGLRNIAERNIPVGLGEVRMTHADWRRK